MYKLIKVVIFSISLFMFTNVNAEIIYYKSQINLIGLSSDLNGYGYKIKLHTGINPILNNIEFDIDNKDSVYTALSSKLAEYNLYIKINNNIINVYEYENKNNETNNHIVKKAINKPVESIIDDTDYIDYYSEIDNIDNDSLDNIIKALFNKKYSYTFINHRLFIRLDKLDLKRLKVAINEYNNKTKNLLVNMLIVNASDNALEELGTNLDALINNQHTFKFSNKTTDILDSGLLLSGNINIFNYVYKYLHTKNNSYIKAKPSLVVSSGKSANFVVGSNVPVKVSENENTNNDKTTTQIKRQDVGLKLTVKPYLRYDGTIDIKLNAEQSSLVGAVDGAVDLVYTKQQIDTVINLQNDSLVILGGLTSAVSNEFVSKVPFLSRIPVIGKIFRYTKKSNNKSNLMLFIKVSVLNSAKTLYQDNRNITQDKIIMHKKIYKYDDGKTIADIY